MIYTSLACVASVFCGSGANNRRAISLFAPRKRMLRRLTVALKLKNLRHQKQTVSVQITISQRVLAQAVKLIDWQVRPHDSQRFDS